MTAEPATLARERHDTTMPDHIDHECDIDCFIGALDEAQATMKSVADLLERNGLDEIDGEYPVEDLHQTRKAVLSAMGEQTE